MTSYDIQQLTQEPSTMAKQKPNRTVEYGAGWTIEYSPMDKEYIAVIKEVGPVGFAKTKDEARDLIHDWMFDQVPA
jgi:hypothetical protein